MDLRAFRSNVYDCVKTTVDLWNAGKKLIWLYGLGNAGNFKSQIAFKFPFPIGKIKLAVRNNKGSDAFIFSEVFNNQCYHLSVSGEIRCILDLGANAGFTAVYYSKFFPLAKIICVEPMPENVSVLKENLSLNNVNSIVFEAAATITNEKVYMETGDKDYGGKVHNIPFGKKMNNGTLLVEGLTINTIIDKLKLEKIDIVKIDIEGYEGVLLINNNDWLAKADNIIMEIHEGVTIDSIKNAMNAYGFANAKCKKGNWIFSKMEIS